MRAVRLLAGMAVVVALLSSGCMSGRDQISAAQQATTYWPLDSLALTYADPVAVAPINDHPLRWIAFGFHPAGVAADYAINRLIYNLVSIFPGLFGYTAEDAGLNSQRQGLIFR